MRKWFGKFLDPNEDPNGEAFMLNAGYPSEVAKSLGPAPIEISFNEDEADGSIVMTVCNPNLNRRNELRFKLGEETTINAKGFEIVGLHDWNERTRTLHSHYRMKNADWVVTEYSIDFEYAEDYGSLTQKRRAGQITAVRHMKRTA